MNSQTDRPASKERQRQYWHDAMPLMVLMFTGAKPEQIDPIVDELMEKYPGYDPT
jgi:hypothetical protein